MASTVTLDAAQQVRNRHYGSLSLGSSYATGGVAVTPQQLGFQNAIQHLQVSPSGGYTFEWLPASNKVKAYWSGTAGAVMNEVTAATDLHLIAPRFEAVGY